MALLLLEELLDMFESTDNFDSITDFVDNILTMIMDVLKEHLTEHALTQEILNFSGHFKIAHLIKLLHKKLDVFNFIMRKGYSMSEIREYEQKLDLELSPDIPFYLSLCKPILFPLIFNSHRICYDYLNKFNPYSQTEYVPFDYKKKLTYYDWYSVTMSHKIENKKYYLSPECLLSPINKWNYLTQKQINNFFIIDAFIEPRRITKPGTRPYTYYQQEGDYDIQYLKNNNLRKYLQFISSFEAIKKEENLNDRFILMGGNMDTVSVIEIGITVYGLTNDTCSYLIYDKYSTGILIVTGYNYIQDETELENEWEYFWYESFVKYLESHIYIKIDSIFDIEIEYKQKSIEYIKDYVSANNRDCVILLYEFLMIKSNDKNDDIFSDINLNDIELEEFIENKEIIISNRNALTVLKKYLHSSLLEKFGDKFLSVLSEKINCKLI